MNRVLLIPFPVRLDGRTLFLEEVPDERLQEWFGTLVEELISRKLLSAALRTMHSGNVRELHLKVKGLSVHQEWRVPMFEDEDDPSTGGNHHE